MHLVVESSIICSSRSPGRQCGNFWKHPRNLRSSGLF